MWINKNNFKSLKDFIEKNNNMTLKEYLNMPECPIDNLMVGITLINKFKGCNIHIVADYDVDGICSGYEMYLGCTEAGFKPHVRFPKRFSEGYGLSPKIVDEILNTDNLNGINSPSNINSTCSMNNTCNISSPNSTYSTDNINNANSTNSIKNINSKSSTKSSGLVILVDNGITAIEQVKRLKDNGYTVMIIDHHIAKNGLPNADVIINQSDGLHDESVKGYSPYCASGLVYKFFEKYNELFNIISEKTMNTMKITAGIATVADVVPMKNGNRKIVKKALELMNDYEGLDIHIGLKTLLAQLNIQHFTTTSIGYSIGPMLNAPGRLEDSGALISVSLLAAKSEQSAINAFNRVKGYNEKRQLLTDEQLTLAIDILKKMGLVDKDKCTCQCIIVADSSFHPGICGIIAGKLCEKYYRPAIVLKTEDNNIMHGSARSVDEVNLVKLLMQGEKSLSNFGGHPKAAGLSLNGDNFVELFNELNSTNFNLPDTKDINIDFEVEEKDFSEFINNIESLEPFGEGNPAPIVKTTGYALYPRNNNVFAICMGKDGRHIKLYGEHSDALGFNMAFKYKMCNIPKKIDIVGTLSNNYFNGNVTPQIEILDFEPTKIPMTDFAKELNKLADYI